MSKNNKSRNIDVSDHADGSQVFWKVCGPDGKSLRSNAPKVDYRNALKTGNVLRKKNRPGARLSLCSNTVLHASRGLYDALEYGGGNPRPRHAEKRVVFLVRGVPNVRDYRKVGLTSLRVIHEFSCVANARRFAEKHKIYEACSN